MAIDIATCQTEESRLAWVFKLYDVDNDGVIDVKEMAVIMETLETLDSSGINDTYFILLGIFSKHAFNAIEVLIMSRYLVIWRFWTLQ